MKYWMMLLSVVGPLAIACHLFEFNPILTFACSAAALVPLGALMEHSTDELADYLGPTLGGLLNATLGNAPDLIIASLALSKGLQDVVKASIAGSILGNLLLANGLSMAIGGWGRAKQKFCHESAGLNSDRGCAVGGNLCLAGNCVFRSLKPSQTKDRFCHADR